MKSGSPVVKEFQFGGHRVVLETGKIARQATGAVMATMGDTVVLCTVVANPKPNPNQDFFPLTVNYQEKFYATGKIPGGFLRREGRPSDKETLTSRLIDRPIRPLFPKGFMNAVQVIATVMSVDRDMDPDIIALIGSSAALAVSGIPFAGPIAAARVGFADGRYLLNPGYEEMESSALNMVVAGTESAVLMVESQAQELTEDQMLGGVLYGHMEMQVAIDAIKELAAEAGKPRWEFQPPTWTRLGRSCRKPVAATAQGRLPDPRQAGTPRCRTYRPRHAARGTRRRCRRLRERRHRGCFLQAREGHRPGERLGRRTTHRRTGHEDRASDQRRGRRPAEGARFGLVPARRDAGHRGGDLGHAARRKAHRGARRHVQGQLHAALQLPAVQCRRGSLPGRPEAPGDRPRATWLAAASQRACRPRRSSRTRCASSPRSRKAMARVPWPVSAAVRSP